MRVAVWGPLPPARTSLARYGADLVPALARHCDLVAVVEDPRAVDRDLGPAVSVTSASTPPEADLHVYQVSNSPGAAFAYSQALERPGVVLLHQHVLHDVAIREAERGRGIHAYLREMRRAHGEAGLFVGRQLALGRAGPMLPVLFPVTDRLVETSLGVVTLTRMAGRSLRRRHPDVPLVSLPRHVPTLQPPPPDKETVRRSLGLPLDAFVVAMLGGWHAREEADLLEWAVSRLGERFPIRLLAAEAAGSEGQEVKAGPVSGIGGSELRDRLVAADVVASLGFPSRGEMPAGLVLAMALGRPVLVTVGTAGAEEMPEGAVIPVDPDAHEERELVAFLRTLLESPELRKDMGDLARAHVESHHAIEVVASGLARFLGVVHARRDELRARAVTRRADEGTLKGYLVEELRGAARDLGLSPGLPGIESLLEELAGDRTITEQ